MEILFKPENTDTTVEEKRRYGVAAPESRVWGLSEPVREHFRKVRSALGLANLDSLCVAICCTSSGEGASWVASKLCCAIAEIGTSVILVDGNLAHPSQASIFDLKDCNDVAAPVSTLSTGLVRREISSNISLVMPHAGEVAEHDFSLRLRDSLPGLRSKAKAILIDCEPMCDSSELLNLAPAIDGVVYVLQAEHERREVVARSIAAIKRSGIRIFGLVLNQRKRYIPGWVYRAL